MYGRDPIMPQDWLIPSPGRNIRTIRTEDLVVYNLDVYPVSYVQIDKHSINLMHTNTIIKLNTNSFMTCLSKKLNIKSTVSPSTLPCT